MAFTTSGQETEWALFLQPRSPHGVDVDLQLPGGGDMESIDASDTFRDIGDPGTYNNS